ncbi:RICIN domain-containing protein [Saccharothrix coeruleofusca]|uniref:Ricin B lectin domain-containing protein n=1 Tax=Saccharothrix coeruleofusca TaxID=33919 RepID=A0A918AKC3_9PSEU|nr:RICIN domain-containing protein [Saccharothrix coeruleofusca]MBP2340026.1 hypothetical protein [Saccharothrix coeruleofusca]GGP37884.1 hypothetical protein GCM10010185_06570 [Saccharothrix coeruleofusca]
MRRTIAAIALVLGATAPAASAHAAEGDFIDRYHNVATGRMLDDSFEHGLRVMPDYGNDHQAWHVHPWEDGAVEIRNVATDRCLDDSFEFGLRTHPCNQMAFQNWFGIVWEDKTVTLVNKVTGRAVDDSFEHGLRSFERNDGPWQRW